MLKPFKTALTLTALTLTLLQTSVCFARDKRTAYVHLFEWTWKDIATECENFLGPMGFSAVQVSPPQEHAVLPGAPWYQRYQPVSYKLVSRSGTSEEFADMTKRCKAVGVDIYVDAVINHMTWVNRSGQARKGSAGTNYTEYKYQSLYEPWDFHRCGRNGDVTMNYQDRWEIQNCNLGVPGADCADLDTGSNYVQGQIASYLNETLRLGAAGFRIDAAKHMSAEDIQNIMARLKIKPSYVFSEVIDFRSEPIRSKEYFGIGSVTEFRYARELARVFNSGRLAWLEHFGEMWGFLPSDKAVVFIDTHDTQRGHGAGGEVLTHKDTSQNRYTLANVFMLAWPYGLPQVMSSYRFNSPDQGPPSSPVNLQQTKRIFNSNGDNCNGEWICEHRWPAIARMVAFRNYTDSNKKIEKWWSDGDNRIAFARGNSGYVIINKTGAPMKQWFDTNLPSGTYCDIISGETTASGTACTGQTINVQSYGWAEITVKPYDAVVIHGGARLF